MNGYADLHDAIKAYPTNTPLVASEFWNPYTVRFVQGMDLLEVTKSPNTMEFLQSVEAAYTRPDRY